LAHEYHRMIVCEHSALRAFNDLAEGRGMHGLPTWSFPSPVSEPQIGRRPILKPSVSLKQRPKIGDHYRIEASQELEAILSDPVVQQRLVDAREYIGKIF